MREQIKLRTVEEVLTTIIQSLPYPEWIEDIDLTSQKDCAAFTWNKTKYLVCADGHTGEIIGDVVENTNASLFLQELIQKTIRSRIFGDTIGE